MSNLLGCILTHQLPFQTYLAAYSCFVDFSLLSQYLYYYKPPPPLPPSERSSPVSASTPLLEDGLLYSVKGPYGSTSSRRYSGVSASYAPAGRFAPQLRPCSELWTLQQQIPVTRSCPQAPSLHPQQTSNVTRTTNYCCEYRSNC